MRKKYILLEGQGNGRWLKSLDKYVDFSSDKLTKEEVKAYYRECWHEGFHPVPVIITCLWATLIRNLGIIAEALDELGIPYKVKKIMIEGIFLDIGGDAFGIHLPQNFLTEGGAAAMKAKVQEAFDASKGYLAHWTVGADVPEIADVIQFARGLGIHISLGHQFPNDTQIDEAYHAGARSFVHLFNASPKSSDGSPRKLGAQNFLLDQLFDDRFIARVIADGSHLKWQTLVLILNTKDLSKISLTGDPAVLAGAPEGERYEVWEQHLDVIPNPEAWRETFMVVGSDNQRLAGSWENIPGIVKSLAHDLNRFATEPGKYRGCSLTPEQIFRMATETPCSEFGMHASDLEEIEQITKRWTWDEATNLPILVG